MSEKLQMEVFKNHIVVPGCLFTKTSVSIAEPNEERFRSAFGFMQTVDGCSAWWWGDLILQHTEWEESESKAAGDSQPRNRQRRPKGYAKKWAELLGREEGYVKDWVEVATFFPSHSRCPELTWGHHLEAKQGAGGDLSVAQGWLDKARGGAWSKTDLRAAIRQTLRREQSDGEPMLETRIQELVAFNRWSRTQVNRVADMDDFERQSLLAELEPASRLIAALQKFCEKSDAA